ncbi:hypothetical protein EZS27_022386 [termite gut metagenome]|uniref:Uncharacterized protein n=1 Tax=termite gut metagenome TaxID=433724 RepID=A0A5J4R6L1_9ZZZZ
MDKTIALSDITANSYVDWFISGKQGINATVQLKGQTRMLVNTGGCYAPIIQGGDDCTDSNLSITIQTDASVLDISITASDIISDDSVKYGRNFILCANLGNGYNDLYIQVSAWARRNDPMEERAFVKNLFYQYLSLENHYLFNYIGDTYVQAVCASYDQSVAAGGQLFQDWFRAQYAAVTDTLQKYKLILAALMKHEKNYANAELSYEQWADMVIAFGNKRWKESKITMESCPFQYIRGVILSKDELDGFLNCKNALQNEYFFPQQITIAASHGSVGAHLEIGPTRPLNFRNYGISVTGASQAEQQNLIAKSIAYAAPNASILIFPELSIDEEIASYLLTQLTNAPGALKLVVGGSHYPKNPPVQGSYTNSAPIFYKSGSGWIQLAVYDKMIPFSMGYTQSVADAYGFDTGKIPLADYDLLVEDIQITPRVVILPAKDGVIGIAICRDAMDLLDPHNPIHKYCTA